MKNINKKIVIPIGKYLDTDFKSTICVKIGQKICSNDILISSKNIIIPTLYSPTTGIIEKIGFCSVLNENGKINKELCIVIIPKKENFFRKTRKIFQKYSSEELIKIMFKYGIKLGRDLCSYEENYIQSNPVSTILINGIRYESYLTNEDYLIRNYAIDILISIKILHAIFSSRIIFIIEKKK